MKKALLGLSNNIFQHKEKIKLWYESFRCNSNGDVILMVANPNDDDIKTLSELNINYTIVSVEDTSQINHKRLEHTKKLISDTDYDVYLITDVFDVIFQGDPFLKMDTNNYDLFVGGEGILIKQEPWNFDVIKKVFPNSLENCLSTEIICSGIIGGTRLALIDLYDKMFNLCEEGNDGHNIKDQAALIVLIAENKLNRLKIFNLDDGWAVHCAVAGPTQFFESWGFKNNLMYGIPKMENNIVVTSQGIKYDMVHQFNRIPEWDEKLKLAFNDMNKTAVVICTYHRTFNGDGNKVILNYVAQNFKNFYVLFDNHTGITDEEISKNYGGAKICSYNDFDLEINGFNKPISRYHFWGSHQNPKYFYAHFRMLTFYLKNPNYKYYWFFDDDVIFNGDLKDFLNNYETEDDDFLVIQAFKKENYPEFPKISVINSRMEGSRGYWLGHCPGSGDNFKNVSKHIGSFFPIVRLSNRAMEHLLKLHNEGYYGYSEGFVPTSLASDGFKVSSMLDEFNNFYKINNNCELYHKGSKFTWEWL